MTDTNDLLSAFVFLDMHSKVLVVSILHLSLVFRLVLSVVFLTVSLRRIFPECLSGKHILNMLLS